MQTAAQSIPIFLIHRHATALNLGDEALCIALATLLPASAVITEMVNEPFGQFHPGQRNALPETFATRAGFARLLNTLQSADALIVGGGDLILGFPQHYLLLRVCRRFGIPVYHVGVGVNLRGASPLTAKWSRHELPQCARFWIRDHASVDKLRELGVSTEKIIEVPDLVYSLNIPPLLAAAPAFPDDWRGKLHPDYLVVSVRHPESNSARWGEAQYATLAAALDELATRHNLQIVFLPFLSAARDALRRNTPHTKHDEQVAQRVIDLMQNKSAALLATGDLNAAQALKLLAGARLTIGTRLHSLIFSSVVHTPFVALSYNLKTESFMRDLGWQEFTLPIDQLTANALMNTSSIALTRHAELSAQLQSTHQTRHAAAARYEELTPLLIPLARRPGAFSRLLAWTDWLRFRLKF